MSPKLGPTTYMRLYVFGCNVTSLYYWNDTTEKVATRNYVAACLNPKYVVNRLGQTIEYVYKETDRRLYVE